VSKHCSPAFIIAMLLSAFMGYLAIVDTSVRAAFSQLASAGITGYFSLTIPQKRDKDDDAPTE
jgi:hypothetical protein